MFGVKLVPSFYSCKQSSGTCMVRLESVRMLPKMYHQIVMLFVLLTGNLARFFNYPPKPNRYYMENLPFIDNVSREPMFFPTSMYIRAKL